MLCRWVSEEPLTIHYYFGIIIHGDRVAPDKCRSPRHFPTKYKMRTTPKGQRCNMEVWKDIPGYEGLYQVSNMGRVKSLERVSGYLRKETILGGERIWNGYVRVSLHKDGKYTRFRLHRLVLSTFSPVEGMERLQVNHIDENKENCRLDNLCWMTAKENNNHGTHNERLAKSKQKPILCVELNRVFDSAKAAETELGIARQNISHVLKGKRPVAGGYHWRYAE